MATETPTSTGTPGAAGAEATKATTAATAKRPARVGPFRLLFSNRRALIGLVFLTVFILLALLAPLIAPGDPSRIGEFTPSQAPSAEHWLGTTTKGQDVLALTLYGGRTSLSVGFIVGIFATLLAAVVGLAAAYFGGVVDDILSVVNNIFLLIPSLPLLVILAAFLPPGPATVMFVLVVTGWAGAARVLRSQALSIRAKDFVAACLVSGERPIRIMFREILPNMASIMMGTFLSVVIGAIGAQAGLEFLGLGDPSTISWGTNLFWASNDGALMKGQWWVFIPSGLCIALVAFGLAMLNYAVDEVTNPRLRKRGKSRSGAATAATTTAPDKVSAAPATSQSGTNEEAKQ